MTMTVQPAAAEWTGRKEGTTMDASLASLASTSASTKARSLTRTPWVTARDSATWPMPSSLSTAYDLFYGCFPSSHHACLNGHLS
jgi:hypothetical protein